MSFVIFNRLSFAVVGFMDQTVIHALEVIRIHVIIMERSGLSEPDSCYKIQVL